MSFKDKKSGGAVRSGLGLNANEWEAPKRLDSESHSFRSSSSKSSGLTSKESKQSKSKTHDSDEYSVTKGSSRAIGDIFDDNASVYSVATQSTSVTNKTNKSHLSLTSNAVYRAGYTANENRDLDDYLPVQEGLDNAKFDPNEDDEDFDRDFYLSEESGQTTGEKEVNILTLF